jgi:hypothetical protein
MYERSGVLVNNTQHTSQKRSLNDSQIIGENYCNSEFRVIVTKERYYHKNRRSRGAVEDEEGYSIMAEEQ